MLSSYLIVVQDNLKWIGRMRSPCKDTPVPLSHHINYKLKVRHSESILNNVTDNLRQNGNILIILNHYLFHLK